jgi:guanine deaminase
VRRLFPSARDYLETYERHGLMGPRSVLAHDVHPTDGELARMGAAGAAVCHCPSSNMFIGSGLFPLRRHLAASVRVCLGTDVGGGTGLSLLKEGLMAYQGQMLHSDGVALDPAKLLWLATRAGALAIGLGDRVGDFEIGRAADVVVLRPPRGSTLEAVVREAPDAEAVLAAAFTLAREDAVAATWVEGDRVHAAQVS